MSVATELPKYVHELNHILLALDAQPDKRWTKTQRELGEALGLAQPVLSLRIKTLLDEGRIRRGAPLPIRGKNHIIELLDATLFDGPVRKKKKKEEAHEDDYVLPESPPEPELPPSLELDGLTPEKVGMAVLKTLHDLWKRQEAAERERQELEEAVYTFRSHLAKEHKLVRNLENEKRELEKQVEEAEQRWVTLREQTNKLIIAQGDTAERGAHYKLRDVLDEDSLAILRVLTTSDETPSQ